MSLALAGALTIVYDERILDEYREVLSRPEHGLEPDNIDDLIAYIQEHGLRVRPRLWEGERFGHADDQVFAEVALDGADFLVTGNTRHFPSIIGGVPVLNPRQFLDRILPEDEG